ncbi:hypothetical protein S101258_00463 [Lactiplantibacillus plantarum subsp. plantarum]|uniref:Uncharacterized protein n=1 Tax=Lactiplantibacillus plantarum subsp. plantarum TaxID=337330 RepID=A0A2S3U924_LACPN|nr:hypothetical protein S101258_00463 [Lactiplantibacillus plantarum subsp. plantarum]
MIRAQPYGHTLWLSWNSDADSVSNTFNIQLAEYDSSGELFATNTVATVTPDADDTDEYVIMKARLIQIFLGRL